jgi:phenylacetate-CoA ligase
MRREIEDAFALRAVDIYGLSEVMGPGVAQEYAATQDGPSIWEDHFYPEIVDPETGAVLQDGEEGELVFTSLTKEAMPIVRYRTRDLTLLLPGSNGPMRRMAKITGRSDVMLIVRGVNLFPTQIEEQILALPALAPHFRIELSRPGRLDVVKLEIEPRADATPDEAARDAALLAERIKGLLGISVAVALCAEGGIARSQGKAQRVVDRRPRG